MDSDRISFKYPDTKEGESIICHKNLKSAIEDFLSLLHEKAGVKFNKSEFVVQALRHYVKYLKQLGSEQALLAEMCKDQSANGTEAK